MRLRVPPERHRLYLGPGPPQEARQEPGHHPPCGQARHAQEAQHDHGATVTVAPLAPVMDVEASLLAAPACLRAVAAGVEQATRMLREVLHVGREQRASFLAGRVRTRQASWRRRERESVSAQGASDGLATSKKPHLPRLRDFSATPRVAAPAVTTGPPTTDTPTTGTPTTGSGDHRQSASTRRPGRPPSQKASSPVVGGDGLSVWSHQDRDGLEGGSPVPPLGCRRAGEPTCCHGRAGTGPMRAA